MKIERRTGFILAGILAVAFLHGLLYVFLIPPWQHYDEPNHFEVAALVARRHVIPAPGDFDPDLTRRIFRSRVRHGFWAGQAGAPTVDTPIPDGRVDGYSQLDEPPLYYLLAAVPIALVPPERVDVQLYSARLVSLALFLLTVLSGWGAARQIVAPGSPLRWMVPLSMALLPGFVEGMTAVNNDVAATTFFSLFFWGGLRMVRRGFSLPDLLLTGAATAACLLSKSTAYLTLALFPAAIVLSLLWGRHISKQGRKAWLWTTGGLVGLVVLLALVGVFQWDDAYGWQRSTGQILPTRSSNPQGVLGEYVIQVDGAAPNTPAWMPPLFQALPPSRVGDLRGQPLTLGVWMWADQALEADLPIIAIDEETFTQKVQLTTNPAFLTLTVQVPPQAVRLWVALQPFPIGKSADARVYYDGLVLVTGAQPAGQIPGYHSSDGAWGTWGDRPFTNLLRNGSGELAGVRLRPALDGWGARVLPDNTRPSLLAASVLDAPYHGWFYYLTAERLFQTFWGYFGWGHVPLQPVGLYLVLAGWTALGVGGATLALYRRRRSLHLGGIFLALLALLGVWAAASLRAPIYMAIPRLYLPAARYAFPAIIPTMMALNLGWAELLRPLRRISARGFTLFFVVYLLIFAALDGLAITSIVQFYAGR